MDRTTQGSVPEWLKYVGYFVLAVVLAAIGWGVAGSVEPGTTPLAATTSTAPTTSAVAPGATTTTVAVTTVSTISSVGTATFQVSQDGVSFGDDSESLEVQLTNAGDAAGAWSISTDHEALNVTPADGELGPGESLALTLALDRAQIEQGDFSAVLTVSWDGGSAEVSAVANIVDTANPIIHNPQASPSTVEVNAGGGCTPIQTTVSARVRDDSDLERVIVRWSDGSGTRETQMSPAGDDSYTATIGPFSSAGTVSARILAFDVHGNAGGADATVEIVDCS